MKFLLLLLPFFANSQTCGTAINIPLDGTCKTINTSTLSSNSSGCVSGVLTYFQFTTDNSGRCVELSFNGSASYIEVHTACTGQTFLAGSSLCMEDGRGVWATDYNSPLQANSTYKVKYWSSQGSVQVCGRYRTVLNDNCQTATGIDGTPRIDNNACHTPGPGVIPPQLCAFTLENTAWYKYVIASNGVSIININSIQCDNYAPGFAAGFQVGFFTGTCTALVNRYCESGQANVSGFVQFTSPVFTAGTVVYVAIDGNGGANCSYEISAGNALILASDTIIRLGPPVQNVPKKKRIYNQLGQLMYEGYSIPYLPFGIYIVVERDRKYRIKI